MSVVSPFSVHQSSNGFDLPFDPSSVTLLQSKAEKNILARLHESRCPGETQVWGVVSVFSSIKIVSLSIKESLKKKRITDPFFSVKWGHP